MIIHHSGIYETQRICIQKTKQYLEKQTIPNPINQPVSRKTNKTGRSINNEK
jgi:hypothetical protein